MVIFLILLCLKSWYAINSDSQSISLPAYTFQIGGKFNISLNNARANSVYIGLCTKEEFKTIQSIQNLDDKLCSTTNQVVNISKIVSIKDSFGYFHGNISVPGTYKTIFYTCRQTFSKYEISVIFQNPLSYLSADIQPCLILKPIILGIFGVLLILWIINWANNFTIRNFLHLFITISIFLNLACQIIEFFETRHKDKYNSHTILTEIKIFITLISKVTLFSVLLMASKGWKILTDSIKKIQIFTCFLLSFLTVLPLTLIQNYSLLNYEIPVMLISAFFMALFLRELLSSINRAIINVYGHLLVISQSGIDPTTTPIYYKSKMFYALSWSLIIYFLFISLRMIISQIFFIPYWTLELSKEVLDILVFSTIMWFFRLRKKQMDDYTMFTNTPSPDEKPIELTNNQVKSFKAKISAFLTGTRKWETGDALPLQPIVMEKLTDRHIETKNKKKIKATQIDNEVDSIENTLL